jgi:hypothetical protein
MEIIIMAIENKSLIAIFLTILIDFILGRRYCIKRYCSYRGIEIKDKYLG